MSIQKDEVLVKVGQEVSARGHKGVVSKINVADNSVSVNVQLPEGEQFMHRVFFHELGLSPCACVICTERAAAKVKATEEAAQS